MTAKAAIEVLAMMGLQGSVLALVALAVVRAGRLRPGWQAAVWLVVLAKFVLPWGPTLPWSLSDLFAALRSHDEAGGTMVIAPAAPLTGVTHGSPLWMLLASLWATGTLFVLSRGIAAHRRAIVAARRALPAPAYAQELLASLVRRPPRLVVGTPTVGPHVVGIVRPVIVIPPALLGDTSLLRAALLHELAHVRRRDALVRIIQLVALSLFFFWPLMRLVNRRLDAAREAACDAAALEASTLSRPAYARLLVRMAQLRTVAAPAMANPHGLDARVAAVLGPTRAHSGIVHKLALLGWIALSLGGARAAGAHGDRTTCKYTPQLAAALYQAHPEADRDGDGSLSRDEACEFQAELRRKVDERHDPELVSRLPELDENLLSEPLCCNCDHAAENSAPWIEAGPAACTEKE